MAPTVTDSRCHRSTWRPDADGAIDRLDRRHPDCDSIALRLAALGIAVDVAPAPRPTLTLHLRSEAGAVRLNGSATRRTATEMSLRLAHDPTQWFESVVGPWFARFGRSEPTSGGWVGSGELIAGEPPVLQELHERLVEHLVPSATAATYLCGWYAGPIAELVGAGLATARAAVLVDLVSVRWHVDDEAWADRVDAGPLRFAVTPDHPWAGEPGVELVPTFDDVIQTAGSQLVTTTEPLVAACRRLARVGLAGLWNEVGDALTMAVCRRETLGVDGETIDVLHRAARSPGTPWKAHARLWLVDTRIGTACVGQKGGCCRAYLAPDEEEDADDPDVAEFWRRFPRDPGSPLYCGTCSLRNPAEAEARQLFWFERRSRHHPTDREEQA